MPKRKPQPTDSPLAAISPTQEPTGSAAPLIPQSDRRQAALARLRRGFTLVRVEWQGPEGAMRYGYFLSGPEKERGFDSIETAFAEELVATEAVAESESRKNLTRYVLTAP